MIRIEEFITSDLFISQFVVDEISLGDPELAQKRLDFIRGIEPIVRTDQIIELADVYQKLLQIPMSSKTDCSHLACCVVASIHYLLTWNCAHLGAISYEKLKFYNDEHGLWTPLLITPDVLNIDYEEII